MTFAETASSSTTRPLVEESAASRIPVNGRLAKSLDLLEFPAVRERLARYASCPLGVDLALALVPSSDAAVVERLGLETAEARALLSEGVDISFPGVVHVQAHVGRAAKSGTLTGLELREVYTALQGAHQARQTLVRRRASRPLLASIAGRVPELQDLAKAIAQAIGTQGEVTDSASPLLREVRSEARIVYQRLEDMLLRIARSSLGRNVLQEALVTQRNGRAVLPVKSSERGRLPGLVHDVSESGATIFVEPLAAIPMSNRVQELRATEGREVERVLRALSGQVGTRADDVLLAVDLVGELDLLMAKARFGSAIHALPSPMPVSQDMTVQLEEARHPLLRGNVVPLSLAVGPGARTTARPVLGWTVLVITGPNAGGKTVALKTLGLMALMHQAGLQLPAEAGTALPVFDAIYADIGDQQSLQQSLSSFTAHATALEAVLQHATPRSLVLLDELGASTDPEEGAALGKAVLETLVQRGVDTVATTHYREIAAFAEERPGMLNASVELDPRTLAPTYRLTLGLPGRSYAFAIAAGVGVDPEVIERARILLPTESRNVDALLAELQGERAAASEARRQADAALRRTDELRAGLERRLESIEQEREEAVAQARLEVQQRAQSLLAELAQAEEAVKAAQGAAIAGGLDPSLFQARERVGRVRKAVQSPQWRPPRPTWEQWLTTLRPGDPVRVRGFHVEGRMLTLPDGKGTAQVQLGALRLHVQTEQLSPPGPSRGRRQGSASGDDVSPQGRPSTLPLRRAQGQGQAGSGRTGTGAGQAERARERRAGTPAVGEVAPPSDMARLRDEGEAEHELDVRGLRADEALERLEGFLDRALLHGLSRVQVIHGAGTGALRAAVRERLSQHPTVKDWSAPSGARGNGATVVRLA